jgi:CheY-like chemotaxis protein
MTSAQPAPARIFMAEDNPGDVLLMTEALDEIGLSADIEVAIDGAAAVESLLAADHQAPDLIVLNFNLPKLRGHQVLDAVKRTERLRGVPVVMLTTSDAHTDRLLCESADDLTPISGPPITRERAGVGLML